MAKHTQDEMEKLSLADLKQLAGEDTSPVPEPEPEKKPEPVVAAEPVQEEAEQFVASRELDLGDGAGVEIFEATGESKEQALEALADKIADAKLNASKKIRQQEAELRDFRSRSTEAPKPKELSPDDEYVIAQELQKNPSKAFRRMFKDFTGCEPEEFTSVKQAYDAFKQGQNTSQAIETFVATHPDYEDAGSTGEKNGALMRMKLKEMGLPPTSENLSKAYSHLKQGGLLSLKGEEAHSDTNGEAKEPERIATPVAEPTPQRTRKASGISTQSRPAAIPASTEPSEADAYNMPIDQLRNLANKQLSAR